MSIIVPDPPSDEAIEAASSVFESVTFNTTNNVTFVVTFNVMETHFGTESVSH